MNPEIYSYLFPKLLENGALDVFTTPIVMKKNRPANILSVLCKAEFAEALESILFLETPTLGIRKYSVERNELERRFEKITTIHGEINLKIATQNRSILKFSPEYDDCNRIALETGIPIIQIFNEAVKEGQSKLF